MIARCPQCHACYRIAREKIGTRGTRLRCTRCSGVFRVLAPGSGGSTSRAERSAVTPSSALVAETDDTVAAAILSYLEGWQLQPIRLVDGGDALLRIFRSPPELAVIGGHLPGIGGRVLTEIVRRTPSLRAVRIVRVAPLDEPVGAPEFEADANVEPGDLPGALGEILKRLRLGVAPEPLALRSEAPADRERGGEGAASSEDENPQVQGSGSTPATEDPPPERRFEPSTEESRSSEPSSDPRVAEAQRLARIIISDIVLYNEERFDRAVQEGTLATALQKELDEGRRLFHARVPDDVRAQRDFLDEELRRIAEKRRGACGIQSPGATA